MDALTNAVPPVAPSRVLFILLRFWWILVIGAVLGAAVAFGYSSTLTPIYQSTASTYFSIRSATSGSDINQGSTYTQNQMLSFAQLATSAIVLNRVRDNTPVDMTDAQIRSMCTVSIPQNTVILDITCASPNKRLAAGVANNIAASLAEVVAQIAPAAEGGETTIVARVIDEAQPALFQSSPNKQRDALLGGIAGLVLAGIGVAVWATFDTRVRSEDVLRRTTDLPLLGSIPRMRTDRQTPIVTANPNGTVAEAYRGLRSSLRFSAVERVISAIAVTSCIPGEGKTTTAVNLALTYAETGMSVLLVDADLRRPAVAKMLGLEDAVGLTTVLVGEVGAEEAWLTWGDGSIWVLPAGEVPPNPAELLSSDRMSEVLAELRELFDIMIVDTAPLLSVTDATIIAQHVDSTILVVDTTKTRLAQMERGLTALRNVRATIAGVVFTRVKRRARDSYYYGPTTATGGNGRTTDGGDTTASDL